MVDEQLGLDSVFAVSGVETVLCCYRLSSRELGGKCAEDGLQAFPASEINCIGLGNDDMMIGGCQGFLRRGSD